MIVDSVQLNHAMSGSDGIREIVFRLKDISREQSCSFYLILKNEIDSKYDIVHLAQKVDNFYELDIDSIFNEIKIKQEVYLVQINLKSMQPINLKNYKFVRKVIRIGKKHRKEIFDVFVLNCHDIFSFKSELKIYGDEESEHLI